MVKYHHDKGSHVMKQCRPSPPAHHAPPPQTGAPRGFTLVELIIVMGILGILMSVAIPGFTAYRLRAQNAAATSDIRTIEKDIFAYFTEQSTYPPDLATVGRGALKDPWGNPYQYLRITASGDGRQDTVQGDVNTDFDLYSRGVDGVSVQSVNDPSSSDDILRVNDGAAVVRAGDYF